MGPGQRLLYSRTVEKRSSRKRGYLPPSGPLLADILCDVLHGGHQVLHVPVPLGPQVLVEAGVYLPIVRVGAPGDVLVLDRDRRVAFEATFPDQRLEVFELVPVADDPSPRCERG